MDYILAIDDTDDLTSPGTGEHLERILALLEQGLQCKCERVTRHQLFFSPLVKYTSHNSAMASVVRTDLEPGAVFSMACVYLRDNAAKGSDPGVCLLHRDAVTQEQREALRDFGRRAKTEYIEKEEAIELAQRCGIRLCEVGGEGIGIIGALAGAALRLDGNDGRYKGKFDIGVNGDFMRCADILTSPMVDAIQTEDGTELKGDVEVLITDRIKTVYMNNRAVLLVKKTSTDKGEVYANLSKQELRKY